jgi:hypothetical protein
MDRNSGINTAMTVYGMDFKSCIRKPISDAGK